MLTTGFGPQNNFKHVNWRSSQLHIANCMEQNPSGEAYRFSASRKIFPHFTDTRSFILRSQEPASCPYPEPDQSYPGPPSNFLKIHFKNITFTSYSWSLSFRFPHQNSVCNCSVLHACYTSRPPHSQFHKIIFDEQCRTLSSSLCSLLQSPVASPLLGPNILFSKRPVPGHS